MSDKKTTVAFKAISDFVEEIYEAFGVEKKDKPLALYHRLITGVTFHDTEQIKRQVSIFTNYVVENKKFIHDKRLPLLTSIRMTDRVYIDLPKYIKQADSETINVIRQHLLTILSIVEPDQSNLDILAQSEKAFEGTGIDFQGMMEKMKGVAEKSNADNPMALMSEMMSSGVMQDMMSSIQNSFSNGNINPQNIFSLVQNMMGAMTPPQPTDTSVSPQSDKSQVKIEDKQEDDNVE